MKKEDYITLDNAMGHSMEATDKDLADTYTFIAYRIGSLINILEEETGE